MKLLETEVIKTKIFGTDISRKFMILLFRYKLAPFCEWLKVPENAKKLERL